MKNKVTRRRRKGTGSLLKLNGRWALRWTEDGVRRMEATDLLVGEKGSKEKAEAMLHDRCALASLIDRRMRLAMIVDELQGVDAKLSELGKRIVERSVKKTVQKSVGELGALWEASPRRREHSEDMMNCYRSYIAAFVSWCGEDVAIRDVDDAKADAFAAHIAGIKAPSTYNKYINCMEMVWKVVYKAAGCTCNPWQGIARKSKKSVVRRALTREETDALIAAADGEMKTLVRIALANGLRLGDACLLTWEDMRDGAVRTRKTGVTVPILPETREIVGCDDGRTGYVMPWIAGLYSSVNGTDKVLRVVKKAWEKAGVEYSSEHKDRGRRYSLAGFHALRHTFVTRAIERGVPPAMVQVVVGHTTAAMTEHYTHVGAEAVAKAFAERS